MLVWEWDDSKVQQEVSCIIIKKVNKYFVIKTALVQIGYLMNNLEKTQFNILELQILKQSMIDILRLVKMTFHL